MNIVISTELVVSELHLVETILLSGRQDDAQTLTDQIFKQQLDHEAEKTLSKKRK